MTLQVIKTSDESTTLYVSELDETYHSTYGAIQESRHVFIKNGLRYLISKNPGRSVNILEIGFGTGLNALLSLIESMKFFLSIDYTALEPSPLPDEIVKQLNYVEIIGDPKLEKLFTLIHQVEWDQPAEITPNFRLEKRNIALQDYQPSEQHFNIIYFDAFAPSKQPELWTMDMIRKTINPMMQGGIWVTYSAKGQLKRDLKSLGLKVDTLPGPPGKKEMVRGSKHRFSM